MNNVTIAQFNTAIDRMARLQVMAGTAIAQVMVMALWGANVGIDDSANAEFANVLLKNLRKGVKKDAIVAVLEHYGNLAFVSGTFIPFAAGKGWAEDEVKAIRVACAGWENFKKAPIAVADIDVIDELDILVEKLTKKLTAGKLQHADKLDRVRALLGELKGEVLFG